MGELVKGFLEILSKSPLIYRKQSEREYTLWLTLYAPLNPSLYEVAGCITSGAVHTLLRGCTQP
ncbi:hypothetical protein M3J09_009367 [Ascochyta lentis]